MIGHEIGHGFDDQGSRYDGDGNLIDWWTDDDRAGFDERAAGADRPVRRASSPHGLPGHHVNGALTVGENIGDLGGITIAHKAYQLSLEGEEAAGDRRPDRRPAGVPRLGPGVAHRGAARPSRSAAWPSTRTRRRSSGPTWSATSTSSYEAFDVTEDDAHVAAAEDDRVRIW